MGSVLKYGVIIAFITKAGHYSRAEKRGQLLIQITEAFKGKTLVITGGYRLFCKHGTVLKHFLNRDIGEIRIISKDEKKQDWMRHKL